MHNTSHRGLIVENHAAILTTCSKQAYEKLSQQNALCPINQLPTEILCKIFVHTKNARSTDMTPRYGDPDILLSPFLSSRFDFKQQLMWINLTYVCVHWRNVALHDPALWTTPPFIFSKWASCMLQRSQRAALTAVVTTSNISPETISALLQHVFRLETLVVNQIDETRLPLMQQIFDSVRLVPAPILRCLRIYRFTHTNRSSRDGNVILPKDAFIGAVRLRELHLSFVDVDWDCHLLSYLTSLSLRNISNARRPTTAQFRSMIERNPDLQELTLENALPSSRVLIRPTKFTSERILLAHLKVVTLELTLPQLKFLSATIAFPPSINRISISLMHTDGYDLASLLSDMMHQYPWSQIRSVAVEAQKQRGEPFMRFIMSPTLASDRWRVLYDPAEIEDTQLDIGISSIRVASTATLDVDDTGRRRDPTSTTMEQLFKTLQSAHLVELVCSRVPKYLMSLDITWATTFGTFPGLRTVIVNVDAADTLISAFRIGLGPSMSPAFPNLSHLEIRDYGEGMSLDVAELRNCLLVRKEHGLELTSLKLINCKGSWVQDVDKLKELVLNIDHLERKFAGEKPERRWPQWACRGGYRGRQRVSLRSYT